MSELRTMRKEIDVKATDCLKEISLLLNNVSVLNDQFIGGAADESVVIASNALVRQAGLLIDLLTEQLGERGLFSVEEWLLPDLYTMKKANATVCPVSRALPR